jgi:hypothetical protein
VIDCYRSHSLDFMGQHNNKTDRIRSEKRVNMENKHIHRHIEGARSSYENDLLSKEYEKNRVK